MREGDSATREIASPAVNAAKQQGIEASGPYPADTVYLKARDGAFALAKAMGAAKRFAVVNSPTGEL